MLPSDLRPDLHSVFDGFIAAIEDAHARIDALESRIEQQSRVVAFSERRASWSVKQLATDLAVHPNTVLSWLALPADHPRHLASFQPGGTGPHLILPEYVADWIARNQQEAA